MAEILVKFDPKTILEEGKIILTNNGLVPSECPSPNDCLSLNVISLFNKTIRVRIDANPPELPTKKEGFRYETYPACNRKCGICGNRNIGFEIRQDSETGEILSSKSEWVSGRM